MKDANDDGVICNTTHDYCATSQPTTTGLKGLKSKGRGRVLLAALGVSLMFTACESDKGVDAVQTKEVQPIATPAASKVPKPPKSQEEVAKSEEQPTETLTVPPAEALNPALVADEVGGAKEPFMEDLEVLQAQRNQRVNPRKRKKKKSTSPPVPMYGGSPR